MTIQQALKTVVGAKINSANVPSDELKSALLTLRSAAARCLVYDKQVDAGELVKVIRCKDCKYYRPPFCLLNDNKNGWLNHTLPEHFCAYGERRADGA